MTAESEPRRDRPAEDRGARRTSARGRWRLAVVCLALGVLTNLVVAGVAAARVRSHLHMRAARWAERIVDSQGRVLPWPDNGRAPAGSFHLELSIYEGREPASTTGLGDPWAWLRTGVSFSVSRLRTFQNFTPAGAYPRSPAPEEISRGTSGRWARAVALPWLTGTRPWEDSNGGGSIIVKASGWPLRCFSAELRHQDFVARANGVTVGVHHTWSAVGGILLGNPDVQGYYDWPPVIPAVIPIRPIWPEFVGNTVFYAAAWALLVVAIPMLTGRARRGRRIRQGRCPDCGYDRRGLASKDACPECGLGARS